MTSERLCNISIFALLVMLAVITPIILHASTEPVRMVTGGEAGTYIKFGDDIKKIVEKAPYNQPLELLKSSGSIDNIKRITEGNGSIALGIVQSDILGFLARSTNENTRGITERLSLIFPFYEEEVHILARRDIKGLRDLQGKRLVVGQEGSGNMLTAMNILALSEIQPGEIVQIAPAEGVVAVLSGTADAMIFVGGKPVALFDNLSELQTMQKGKNAHLLENIHLIPIDDQRVFSEYSPTRINKGDYPFVDNTILTAKVTALLVSYEPQGLAAKNREKYCEPLRTISRAIAENSDSLTKNGHAKWKEVKLYDDIMQWPRNSCMWEGKRFTAISAKENSPVAAQPQINDALSKDLLNVLKYGKDGKK